MRFDPDRVLELARTWQGLRMDPSRGERLVADEVAGAFERAGLSVDRMGSVPIDRHTQELALFLGLLPGLEAAFQLEISSSYRVGLLAMIPLSLLVVAGWVGRQTRKNWRSRGLCHIIGKPGGEQQPPARIILMTRIDTLGPGSWSLWLVALWGVFGFLGLLLFSSALARAVPDFRLNVLFGQWLIALWIVLYPTWGPRRPSLGEDVPGLALLAELALTWPRTIDSRVETWFIATPDPRALARDLLGLLAGRRDSLVILLDTPGMGREVVIDDRGPAARMARAAARDLWIPYKLDSIVFGPSLQTFSKSEQRVVRLRGTRDDGPINPALLAATGQLVTEIALRWAKQAENPAPVS
jgi:hypothetical protein